MKKYLFALIFTMISLESKALDYHVGDVLQLKTTTSHPSTAVAIKTATPSFYIYDSTGTLLDSGTMTVVNPTVMGSWKASQVLDSTTYSEGNSYFIVYQMVFGGYYYERSDTFRLVSDTVSLSASSEARIENIDTILKIIQSH